MNNLMRKKIFLFILICTSLVVMSSCAPATPAHSIITNVSKAVVQPIETYTYTIVDSWPHDAAAFTQGLVFEDGILYESTGLFGESSIRIVDLETGSVQSKTDVAAEHFAEGLTKLNGKLYQLTWQSNKGFIYDENSLELIGEFSYQGEGWGLTDDGQSLIMSNGSNVISFHDPETFEIQRTIEIFDNGTPVTALNELEYINGKIYANIWHNDRIVQVSAQTGKILGWIDLTNLLPAEQRQNPEAVLNGIAYDQGTDRLFVTGKLWPTIFEIDLKN